jgi:RsiW-degrading membrane proteinase PrsW (M82 family)
MNYLVILLPVILPVLFWAAYHLHVDRHLPEPAGHLVLAFLLGVGSYYLGMFMYFALGSVGLRYDAYLLAESSLTGLFAYSLLAIGLIEELAKMIPFLLIVLRFREFDEPIDGIIYGSFIALGFAAVENIYYLQFLGQTEAYARGFAGPVLHIVFASIWAYYIGRAYDFIVIGLPAPALPIAVFLIAGIWIWRLCLIRDLHASLLEPGSRRQK